MTFRVAVLNRLWGANFIGLVAASSNEGLSENLTVGKGAIRSSSVDCRPVNREPNSIHFLPQTSGEIKRSVAVKTE